jgi:hypothetical protein
MWDIVRVGKGRFRDRGGADTCVVLIGYNHIEIIIKYGNMSFNIRRMPFF